MIANIALFVTAAVLEIAGQTSSPTDRISSRALLCCTTPWRRR